MCVRLEERTTDSDLLEQPPWISEDGDVDQKARSRFFNSFWARIRGGFESNKCALLLQDIDRDISKISHLTSITMEVEPLRSGRKRQKTGKVWAGMRESAQSLSEVLQLRWAQPCPCNCIHKANLQLTPQDNDDSDDENGDGHIRSVVLFKLYSGATPAPPLPWKWRDIEVRSFGLDQKR